MPTNTLPLDPSAPDFEAQVEARLIQWEEEYAIETYPAEHRSHLGASSIGDDCHRKLWYGFRWVKLQQAEGRMRRLWQRGKDEEKKFEEFLLWAGFNIRAINPETDKQYVFSKVNGHYGGSTDGTMQIRWAQNFPIIAEYKTFGSKYFSQLEKDGVQAAFPKYFAQMCCYGAEFKVTHCLFYAVNKDTDRYYRKLIKLDWNYARELENKARDIIYSPVPPVKINENAAFYKCKWCDFQAICHYGEAVEKNCRSCINSMPTDNGAWTCKKWNAIIPKAEIPNGCPSWEAIV